jgi:hypothetical protein
MGRQVASGSYFVLLTVNGRSKLAGITVMK